MSIVGSAKRGSGVLQPSCICLGIAVLVALGAWVWRESHRGWTKTQVERLIATELSVNCDRAQVEAWFDKHQIYHSYLTDTTGDRLGNDTMPMIAGLHAQDLIGMERGLLSSTQSNVGFLVSGEIRVYFFFDSQGQRLGHLVQIFFPSW